MDNHVTCRSAVSRRFSQPSERLQRMDRSNVCANVPAHGDRWSPCFSATPHSVIAGNYRLSSVASSSASGSSNLDPMPLAVLTCGAMSGSGGVDSDSCRFSRFLLICRRRNHNQQAVQPSTNITNALHENINARVKRSIFNDSLSSSQSQSVPECIIAKAKLNAPICLSPFLSIIVGNGLGFAIASS